MTPLQLRVVRDALPQCRVTASFGEAAAVVAMLPPNRLTRRVLGEIAEQPALRYDVLRTSLEWENDRDPARRLAATAIANAIASQNKTAGIHPMADPATLGRLLRRVLH